MATGNIIIVGSSGHAKVVIDIVEKRAAFRIAGLVDDHRQVGAATLGYEVLGTQQDLSALAKRHALVGFLLAVGDNHARSRLAATVTGLCPGLPAVSAVHPSASVGRDAMLSEGVVIMAGAVVGPAASVGKFCILNTHSSLDHDSVMGDFSSLAPGTNVGGGSTIGPCSAIGIGARVSHGMHVGEHTVIGAGSTVLADIPAYKVAFGTPAKVIRAREAGEHYL